jgi:hypothetical protein
VKLRVRPGTGRVRSGAILQHDNTGGAGEGLLNGQDRPEPAEAEFYAEQRGHVLGEERA